MPRKKQNTKAYQPQDCAHCKYLTTRVVFYQGRRGVERTTICSLDDRILEGNLEAVNEGCGLKGGEADE